MRTDTDVVSELDRQKWMKDESSVTHSQCFHNMTPLEAHTYSEHSVPLTPALTRLSFHCGLVPKLKYVYIGQFWNQTQMER